jgi:translation initiation factor IF-1
MSKDDCIIFYGTVVELLRNAYFKVKIEANENFEPVAERVVICSISGKIRKFRIRIANFDKVKIEFSPYSLEKGRIVERIKNTTNTN